MDFIKLASCILISREKLLVVHNSWKDKNLSGWTLPCGHVFRGETPRNSSIRELFEETGIVSDCRPMLVRSLQVFKGDNTVILNYLYFFRSWNGNLTHEFDPDKIIDDVRFLPINLAINLLLYEDVKFALRSFLKCKQYCRLSFNLEI